MKLVGILNGPNLNRLGIREPGLYGSQTYESLCKDWKKTAHTLGLELVLYQSNHEGALIDTIHRWADEGVEGVVFNPAAYTHTSVALRDALASTDMVFIEVHISNIYTRESFRHTSYTAPVSRGVISGLGTAGYTAALTYLSGQ
ncbi:type II 3-dehydroquinate dehydratase [Chitinivibrio alkaliphilus]|uniref:3-dehydroquinate dehydratase n=1 Tax=Chitinivibrio alkaliphilus ACht1 TaxID=1313304 RepID=U7D7J0_9BACT|nr:type II 3-dehydroquinate dehydratase [Chitinivibrio alkaliphilus]ERP31546.1 3-dehydroquinate dehydratase [Chitinivibrio alkaliphilus ACht1]